MIILTPLPSLYFLPSIDPLVQISFSPQPFAMKIKDGGYNFCKEISDHSLAKITPALQAIRLVAYCCFIVQNS